MTLRLATWNLQQISPNGEKGRGQLATMAEQEAQVWFLTELPNARAAHVRSPARAAGPDTMRWCGITSTSELQDLESTDEGLALAVAPDLGLLLACSVLPWRGARTSWPGAPDAKLAERFTNSLQGQLALIEKAADDTGAHGVVWAGDFNQGLTGVERSGTTAGRAALLAAIASLGLSAPTAGLESLHPGQASIDHVFVPEAWHTESQRLTPVAEEGRALSDHALYVVDCVRS